LKRKVVVTGLGAVTPLGLDVKESWKALLAGRSGAGPITRFAIPEGMATRFCCEVKGFDPEKRVAPKEVKKMDLFIHFAISAAYEALEQSHLSITPGNAERAGVLVGAGMGGLPYIEHFVNVLSAQGPRRISPFFIPMTIINDASGYISILTGARGPNAAVVTACATGTHSIGMAMRTIQYGDADAMICGGAEATITPISFAGFNALRALSTRNHEPERASRPFEKNRSGFVLGEGAGVLILESEEHARSRGASIICEAAGFGWTGDAHHITAPAEGGEGAVRCMRNAIGDAGLSPQDISYINAHGTSTEYNDLSETQAIKTVFGAHAYMVPVSSPQSMTGHMLGAAGGVEAVISILALRDGKLPPTINYDEPDPLCDLDYVPNVAREARVDAVLSNTFGFGGTNASLVFKRYNG
jgi:3-oxoacyl-[acyl-carrier-protein] synthase II